MKQTEPKQSPHHMEVINRPKIAYTKKSLEFFLRDRRKIVSAIAIIIFPVIGNAWRFVPEDVSFPHYGYLYAFIWAFSINLIILIISVAWYLSVQQKDHVMRIITLSAIAFGVFQTFETMPFIGETPLWADLLASTAIFICFYFCLNYIQKHYLDKPDDYKKMHDGLVYDIHHQRFLSSINRVAGLLEVAEMEEPYKHLCAKEMEELKESIAYIAEKYEALK